jgi:hypothetical protein
MKRLTFLVVMNALFSYFFFDAAPRPVYQEDTLEIRLRRIWGVSYGMGRIQGTITISASGPEDLSQVVFYIDDQVLGEVNQAPFSLQFVTDDYPHGAHTFSASGFTSTGTTLQSNEIRAEFISAQEGFRFVGSIVIPIVVVVLASILVATVVPFIFSRGKKEQLAPGAKRQYGYFGGAICPKCDRPFSRHIYGLNLGPRKLDRCPYCGNWSLVGRASREELEAAEAAEIEDAQKGALQPQFSEETLKRDLDESRFENL